MRRTFASAFWPRITSAGVLTLYQFVIDKKHCLLVQVDESTPEGRLGRTKTFQNLRLNIHLPARFFQLSGGS
jgi:hypothetical protein